ncbi:MAG: glycosyltransferase family 2 protein [Candidatus Omnitrophica bacterium]|nr:glycosyltransferase family 2 protein [Candidatus Omnitrophota bacterium]
MWNGKKVSVIFPTYNEKDSIRAAIEDFKKSGYVDEIVVVNNNAARGTKEEVEKTSARQIFEARQGYGYAIRRGLDEAKGDLVVISEPDGTFIGRDIIKLLVFSDDYDAVWGTRTDVCLVGAGANMAMHMRWGNFLVAKFLQLLFNTTRLSDMGCTFKLFHRRVIDKIKPDFTVGGSHFGPELMILTEVHGFEAVEVPVNYLKRVGTSSVTGSLRKTVVLAIVMTFFIIKQFIKFKIFRGISHIFKGKTNV